MKIKRSILEIVLNRLHHLRIIDVWQETSNKFTNHHDNMWSVVEDMYCENRVFDKINSQEMLCLIGNFENKRGLDFGCGGGQKSVIVGSQNNTDLTVFDISKNSVLKTVQKGRKIGIELKGVRGNGEVLPFKDNSFDYIVSNDCIEHIPDDIKALSEIKRVLKPQGVAVINVPNEWDLRNFMSDLGYIFIKGIIYKLLFRPPPQLYRGHLHMYDRKSFANLCDKIGFSVEEIVPIYAPPSDSAKIIEGYNPHFIIIERLIIKLINIMIKIFPESSKIIIIFNLKKIS